MIMLMGLLFKTKIQMMIDRTLFRNYCTDNFRSKVPIITLYTFETVLILDPSTPAM